MLVTDYLYRDLPNGRELFEAHRLNDRTMAYLQSIPENDRPRRERAIRLCRAAGNLTNVRSRRFVSHYRGLP